MNEPTTTDKRISFFDQDKRLIVYDVPTQCLMCRKCLANSHGDCPYGPFCKHWSDTK